MQVTHNQTIFGETLGSSDSFYVFFFGLCLQTVDSYHQEAYLWDLFLISEAGNLTWKMFLNSECCIVNQLKRMKCIQKV